MSDSQYAVIMAGGKGERFWPLSTSKHPKQVLSLVGGKCLLAQAVERLRGLIPAGRIIVITSADLVRVTARAVPSLPRRNIIGEPFGRDTAAVCALASAIVKARDPDGSFCILTADHIIRDVPKFQRVLREAFAFASSSDSLVTIGIKPSSPNTGFGYIETCGPVVKRGSTTFVKVRRFVEKPNLKTAQMYVKTGRFFWNSGMFVWSVESLQRALGNYRPELLKMASRMERVAGTRGFRKALVREYGKLEKISIDYAVMEHADNIVMVKADFRWDDVGSWTALENHFRKNSTDNVLVGSCVAMGSNRNIVMSGSRPTALLGVRDLVVVQGDNATMVCSKAMAQDVKRLVQLLRNRPGWEHTL
jgi:mannose-1-phosphate guanylyltransferase